MKYKSGGLYRAICKKEFVYHIHGINKIQLGFFKQEDILFMYCNPCSDNNLLFDKILLPDPGRVLFSSEYNNIICIWSKDFSQWKCERIK